MKESIWGIRERLELKMKPKLRIEDDGRRDKGAGEGKTEGFSLRRVDKLQEIIVVRQDLILLRIKSKEKSV